MKTIKDILTEFIQKAADENAYYSLRCKVLEVDSDKNTCKVETIEDKSIITSVQLSAFIGSKLGLYLIPKVGSTVTVSFYSNDEGFITKTSDLDAFKVLLVNELSKDIQFILNNDEIKIIYDNSELKFTTDLISFNSGLLGGLVKVAEMTSRFNDLETLHNSLQNDFNSWIPSAGDGGAALKAVLSAGYLTETVPDSTETDFENENVKQ